MQSCKRPCVEASYGFNMSEFFSPETDSIKVGDTLCVLSSHSTTFTDSSNRNVKQVNFSNSLLSTNIGILQFPDTSTSVVGAVLNFNIITVNGKETGNDNIPSENKGFYYQELNSEYILKLKFVALRKGIYSISVGNSIGVVNGKNGCIKANFEIENSNTNNHLYFYQNWRPGYTISEYELTHMYCFKAY